MLEGLKAPVASKLCALGARRLNLSDSDKELLDNALADTSWATHSLYFALKELGFHVSKDLIGFTGTRYASVTKSQHSQKANQLNLWSPVT